MTNPRTWAGVVCIHAALLLATPAFAQHTGRHDRESREREADAQSGQTAAVDATTGQLRPLTPEEARALVPTEAPGLARSDEGLVEVHHWNGAVSLDLQDRFQDVALAKVNPDGSVDSRCVESAEEARQFLAEPASAKGKKKPARAKPAQPVTAPLEEK
jgi:hypothetical protein